MTIRLGVFLVVGVGIAGCGASDPAPEVDDDLPLAAPPPGIAGTPPMGWNSWNRYGCNISEDVVKQTADAMVARGLQAAGYQFLNIDDCWSSKERAADGSIQPGAKFAGGIAALADYVHARGLKLGLYGDRGGTTCGSFPGALGHEAQDAATYAAWGIDYLKYDNCDAAMSTIQQDFTAMRGHLDAATTALGRAPIVYSICAWNFYEWSVGVGHLWRTTTDIRPTWNSVQANLANNRNLAAYAGPNGWNDPDMLEVGNASPVSTEPDLDDTEQKTHFTMWAMSASPLIAGNNVVSMTDDTQAILTNAELIAIDQDFLALQGAPVWIDPTGKLSVWAKPLNESGARAVVALNEGEAPATITVDFAQVGLRVGKATVRDLWLHKDYGTFTDRVEIKGIPRHGVAALKVKGSEPTRPKGKAYLSDLTWTYAANFQKPVQKDQNVSGMGAALSLGGTPYAKGLAVTAPSSVIFRLAQSCSTFTADVGIDDAAGGNGSVIFQVWADGEPLFDSGVMTAASPVQTVSVSVAGKRRLKLLVTSAGDVSALDRASWGNAQLDCTN